MPSKQYRSCDEVIASFPELVERRFVLSVSQVDVAKLASQVKMKDLWGWQNDHWEELEKEIPALKEKEASDRESRFQALEGLSPKLRAKADDIAKNALVASHPEWLSQHLDNAKVETKVYGIRLQGGTFAFDGIKDRKALIKELGQAHIAEQSPELSQYTQDGRHFYRIKVLDRKAVDELVPLPDLLANGTLDSVLDRILEAAYERVKKEKPSEFRTEKGEWKPFAEVKDKIAEIHFAPLFKRLNLAVKEWKEKVPSYCDWTDLKTAQVAVRFLPLMAEGAECLRVHGSEICNVLEPYVPTDTSALMLESRPMNDLFSFVRSQETIKRKDLTENPALADAFSLGVNGWLPVRYTTHFGPFVAQVKSSSQGEYEGSLRGAVYDLQNRIGEEVIKQKAAEYTKEFFGNEQKDVS
jgi:hypothetical protein